MPSVPPTPLPASRTARPPAPPEAPVTVRWRSWAESLDVDGTPRPSPPPRRQNNP